MLPVYLESTTFKKNISYDSLLTLKVKIWHQTSNITYIFKMRINNHFVLDRQPTTYFISSPLLSTRCSSHDRGCHTYSFYCSNLLWADWSNLSHPAHDGGGHPSKHGGPGSATFSIWLHNTGEEAAISAWAGPRAHQVKCELFFLPIWSIWCLSFTHSCRCKSASDCYMISLHPPASTTSLWRTLWCAGWSSCHLNPPFGNWTMC